MHEWHLMICWEYRDDHLASLEMIEHGIEFECSGGWTEIWVQVCELLKGEVTLSPSPFISSNRVPLICLNLRILPLSYHSKARYHGVSLAGRWWPNIECWLGSFVIFKLIRTSIAMKPYIFVIYTGGGGPDPLSPLWIRPWVPLILRRGLLSYSGQASSTFHDNIRCSHKNNKMTRNAG